MTKPDLEPIVEEQTVGGQIIPYNANSDQVAEIRAKKNELLKKQVKQLTQGSSTITESAEDKETFITGVNAAKASEDEQLLKEYDELVKNDPSFGKKKKYYKYPEDELLDEMD